MTRDQASRHMHRIACLTLAMLAAMPARPMHAADTPEAAGRPAARSHIQPVGEVADAHRPSAPPADATSDPRSVAFGLRVARMPDLLRQHLGLGHGVGLVVTDVAAASPAARCGFAVNDVLVSVDDQSIIVPEQLAILLEATGAAAPRSCTLIRNGTRLTIPLRPAPAAPETPLAAAPASPASPATSAAPSDPPPATDTKRRPLAPTASALALLPNKKKAREIAKASGTQLSAGVVRSKGDAGVVQEDADYSIEVACDDEMRLVVRDARGRRVFEGVIETPEQRSGIPLAVRDRVEHLEKFLRRRLAGDPRQSPAVEIGSLEISPVIVK